MFLKFGNSKGYFGNSKPLFGNSKRKIFRKNKEEMGFFDTIKGLKNAETEPLQPEEISGQVHQDTDTKRQPGTFQTEKKPARRPERFSFLRPCPLCRGKNFIYGDNGGFFCQICQPGIRGTPVEAAGPDRQPPEHETDFQVESREHE